MTRINLPGRFPACAVSLACLTLLLIACSGPGSDGAPPPGPAPAPPTRIPPPAVTPTDRGGGPGTTGPGPATPAAPAPFATTVTNFGADRQPVVRFDVDGNAIDAHDGHLRLFGDTYYLYGVSYDCGFRWQIPGAPFCGFKVYSSPDLVHFTDRGFLFDASTADWQARCDGDTFGCYRPDVVFNVRTGRYVLWINSYDGPGGFHVFESDTPVGPFVEVDRPTLAINAGVSTGISNGDHSLFVDRDLHGYLVYTDWKRDGDIVVELLDDRYVTGSGVFTRLGLIGTEAPALFARDGRYYITVADHLCDGCSTGLGYLKATHPLGPWTGASGRPVTISATSCGGTPGAVAEVPTAGGPAHLLLSDLWKPGDQTLARANYYWGPLEFTADGSILPVTCLDSVPLQLSVGGPGAARVRPDSDQSTGSSGFRLRCDIGEVSRLQTFTAGRSGQLATIWVTTFTDGPADVDLELQVVSLDDAGLPDRTLATSRASASAIGWSAREVAFPIDGVTVVEGQRYGFRMHAALGQGCYGFAYNDEGVYPRGQQRTSIDLGETWALDAERALKFTTVVK
jgi:hypothetical protein